MSRFINSIRSKTRRCLDCGMSVFVDMTCCPKCDSILADQTDGSMLTMDIAHQGERVHEALNKLAKLIDDARLGFTHRVRVVTGSGFIREAVRTRLGDYQFRGDIKSFDYEADNPGVILVIVR